jgi:transposase-like protein
MRRYGREFKLRSIMLVKELVEERGINFKEAAMDMGLSEGLLRRWMRESRPGSTTCVSWKGPATSPFRGVVRCVGERAQYIIPRTAR